jgi:formamidopyrimidine-DNA glycosylase
MPELAEVEFYRRRWWECAQGEKVITARADGHSRDFRALAKEYRGGEKALARGLAGARLVESGTYGKQMWFVFALTGAKAERLWLGIHLGMSGALRVEPGEYRAVRHDALLLWTKCGALVFNDPRQFGRVRAWRGAVELRPPWLENLAPEVLSRAFTEKLVLDCLSRHARAPLKAVLLMQEYFPGIGNWMADEILWRAALPPAWPAGKAAKPELAKILHATIREVTRDALRVIAGKGRKLPPDLNVHVPDTWLFNHRWEDGGLCPRTNEPLRREEIGGRTTCWSPTWQQIPKGRR